jgi:hypothetical protein
MKRPGYRSLIIALGLAFSASMTAYAQPEKISLNRFPEPNQTIRMRMAHDIKIDASFEGDTPAAAALPGPRKLTARTVLALTWKIGALDKEGYVTTEMTYDEFSYEMTMDGKPVPFGDTIGKFIGKTIMAIFSRRGELVDSKIPPDLGLSKESFKMTLKSFYGNLPQTAIGVGEVVTTPLDFTVPIPVPGSPPLKIDGQIKSTLVSVEKDATGRIAKFDQTADSRMVSNMEAHSPTGKIKMGLDFKLSGAGDMVFNIDKGVVKSSGLMATFGGKLTMTSESGETKAPTLNFQGTMNITITGGN